MNLKYIFLNIIMKQIYSKIDYAIQAKAKQIVNSDTSDKPDYYKIGQFVYHYMTYTKELSGKDLSLKEIF